MDLGRQSNRAHMVVPGVVLVVVVVVEVGLDINFEVNSSLTRVSMVTETAIGLFALISVKSSEPISSQFAARDLLKTKAFVIIETASKSIRVDAK